MDQTAYAWIAVVFFAFVLLAIPVVVGLVWAVVWGASYLKNYSATKAMEWVPVQWERKLGDIALAQVRTQTRFISDLLA